ncbi:SsrA-binding protein SmpB [Buchnera aphidicola]|nr:SsrA-binding protein SmpB [Buchnera aphidicola]
MKKFKNSSHNVREIIVNKKVFYDFFIKKIFECGIELKGWEVKSIRQKKINIVGSYIIFYANNIYLFGSTIFPISTITDSGICETKRNRKLLLHRKEIVFLYNESKQNRYTIVPISLIWKSNWCKLKIGLAKGKNKKDKRDKEKCANWKKEQSHIFKKIKLTC